jgi:UDP-2,4-diacetamido-2,4,6-trideoxy-beta-L-altropyranose hydrolase
MIQPHIFFRTDASNLIGTGHVMRCLTLADAFRELGAQSTFICRPHAGNLMDVIWQRGHQVMALEPADGKFNSPVKSAYGRWLGTDWFKDAQQCSQVLGKLVVDWLVVDHYALDCRWEQSMRQHAKNIMVIDDLANRPHDCELLLDQNLGRDEKDYAGLLMPGTQTLIGPQYALLRPEFSQWREYSLARRAQTSFKKILITMGGVDRGNATVQVLDALRDSNLPTDLQVIVIMGQHAPWLKQVQARAAAMPLPTKVLVGVDNMAQLMADSDLCIGAAGGTNWERCALGLPTLLLVIAENQMNGALALQAVGAANIIQNPIQIKGLIAKYSSDPDQFELLKEMSNAAAHLGNGSGTGAYCTAQKMMNFYA